MLEGDALVVVLDTVNGVRIRISGHTVVIA